jgi:hypothetical protein
MPLPNLTALNFDDPTQENLDFRRKLLGGLQVGAFNLPQVPIAGPGATQAKANPFVTLLAPMIQAYAAQKGLDNVASQQQSLDDQKRQTLTTDAQNYMDKMSPQPIETPLQGPTQAGPALTGNSTYTPPADPRQAILDAIASKSPVMQQLGLNQLTNMSKPDTPVSVKDLLPYARGGAIPAMLTKGITGFQPKPEYQNVDGSLYNVGTDTPTKVVGTNYSAPYKGEDGNLYQKDLSTGKVQLLDSSPKVQVNTSVNAGQKKGLEEYWTTAAKKVDALGQSAYNAQNNLQSINELRRLEQNGIFSNNTTNGAVALSSLGQALGIPVDVSKLGNTEAFNAKANELWQGTVSKYGGNRNVTEAESEQLKKITPQAMQSPQARALLYDILERANQRSIQQYQNANQAFARATKADDPMMFANEFQNIYTPAPNEPSAVTQPKAQGVMSLDDYIRAKTGGGR